MASHPAAPRAVPGPPASFLTGNAAVLRRDLLGGFVRDRARYGDLVRYQIGPRPPLGRTFLIVHHPDDVRLVLSQTGRTLSKDTAMFRAAGDVLGHSLLTDDGPGYRRQRRIVQPLFTARQVRRYAPLMLQEALATADALADEDIAPGTAEQVDLHLLAMRYTLRVVGRTLFGDDVERLVPVLDALVPQVGDAIRRRGLQVVQLPMRWPTLRNHRPRRLHQSAGRRAGGPRELRLLSGLGHGRDDLVGRLHDAADPAGACLTPGRTVRAAFSEGDTSPGGDGPGGNGSPRGGDSPRPAHPQEVRDQALVFLLAGHETTAAALDVHAAPARLPPRGAGRVAAELDACSAPGPRRPVDVERLVAPAPP